MYMNIDINKFICTYITAEASRFAAYSQYEKYLSVYQHNLQLLLVGIFKTKNNLNPKFMPSSSTETHSYYNVRSGNHLQSLTVKIKT